MVGVWSAPFTYDQSIIVYCLDNGVVYGGSDPGRKVKQVEKDSGGFCLGGDFTMELDLSNRGLVMGVDETKIIIDAKIGDLKYSPIVVLGRGSSVTLL